MNQAFEKGHRAGSNLVNPAANPYPRHTNSQWQWALGHAEGRQTRRLVQAHEFKVYRGAEQERLKLLWGE